MTCDDLRRAKSLSVKVSIPQAVSTIAIFNSKVNELTFAVVSIPQAVSTIAINKLPIAYSERRRKFQYRKR